jgi:hypothetical protein
MDYMELLRRHDDPVCWMEPPNFDYESASLRFLEFARELSSALNVPVRTETGYLLQDAIYHSEVFIPAQEGRPASIRFSRFGDMVTVMGSEQIPEEWLTIIQKLLQKHGYVYVPVDVLQQPYTGNNPGVDGFPDWLSRYFGW